MKSKITLTSIFISLLSLSLLSSSAVLGQEQQTGDESDLKTKVGLKGGLNLTNLYISNTSSEHINPGHLQQFRRG
jgi:hypothetical protein